MPSERLKTVCVALTGASGLAYGLRLIEVLLGAGCRVYVLYSSAAQVVARQELALQWPSRPLEMQQWLCSRYGASAEQLQVFGREQWYAPLASGSNPADAMVVCPCTMGTLAAIAHGMSDNLIERAADVMLKERRPLILVARETPFSLIHLENMVSLTRAGALIMPANPGFYHHPQTVQDLVDYMVARILDHLQVEHTLMVRWGMARTGEQADRGEDDALA